VRSSDGRAQLLDADKVSRGIGEGAVANAHGCSAGLLDDQNIFRKLGVSSRAAATAYAFQHDLVEDGSMARTGH
jgi:hypothetical protein